MEPENNPYAAPAIAATPEAPPLPLERPVQVGRGPRFLNFLIDRVVVFAMAFVVGLVGAMFFGATEETFSGINDVLLGYALTLVYYIFMEGVLGTTLGKLVTGTKIIGEDGQRPPFSKMLQRSLCRIIPFEPLSYLGSDARGWHDTITKTWVVKSR
ncbi:RDD family protein [Luteolibacter sp. GHJ8]|uniref:RDD family protein n=1 Tax=Luteolibacter rhizosphaerae TaxID=2989719 RepID=A0ABT3G243_9BACT|nr:RDD family protein [Luteolibacter rhizosphaerae]MCW1913898.1 RDD family protein [Luteolibacter rhizosphaerae]